MTYNDKQLGIVATLVPCTMTYNSLDKPKGYKLNGKESAENQKYQATFVFDKDSPALKEIKTTAARVAKAKWPGRSLGELHTPWADGTENADYSAEKQKAAGKDPKTFEEFARDKIVVKASSKFQPRLGGLEGGRIVDYDDEVSKAASYKSFYAGVQVLVELNLVAYDPVKKGDQAGISAYLNGIVTLKKGEKLGGGAMMAERFSGYAGAVTDEDPTAGAEPAEAW